MRFKFDIVFLLAIGLSFLAVGVGLIIYGIEQGNAAAGRLERLVPLTRAALANSQPGQEVLVEGRISSRNPVKDHESVAAIREVYHRSSGNKRGSWVKEEWYTPPLLIDVPDGIISVVNNQYELLDRNRLVQRSGSQDDDTFPTEGTRRDYGLRLGEPVLAIGTLVSGQQELELRAEWVVGSTREQYIAIRRGPSADLPWFGALFVLIGLVVGGIGGWGLVTHVGSLLVSRQRP